VGKNPKERQSTIFDYKEAPYEPMPRKAQTTVPTDPLKTEQEARLEFMKGYWKYSTEYRKKNVKMLIDLTVQNISKTKNTEKTKKAMVARIFEGEKYVVDTVMNSGKMDFSKTEELKNYILQTLRLMKFPESWFIQNDDKDFAFAMESIEMMDKFIENMARTIDEPVKHHEKENDIVSENMHPAVLAETLTKNKMKYIAEELIPDITEDYRPRYTIIDGKIVELSAAELNERQIKYRKELFNRNFNELISIDGGFIGPDQNGSESESRSESEPRPLPRRRLPPRVIIPSDLNDIGIHSQLPQTTGVPEFSTTSAFEEHFPFAASIFKELKRRMENSDMKSYTFLIPGVWAIIILAFVGYACGQTVDIRTQTNIPVINHQILNYHTELWETQYEKCETIVDSQRLLVDISLNHTRNQLQALKLVEQADTDVDRILKAWRGYRNQVNASSGSVLKKIFETDDYKRTILNVMSKHLIEHSWVEALYSNRSLSDEYKEYATKWLAKTKMEPVKIAELIAVTTQKTLNLLPENSTVESLALVPYSTQPLSEYSNYVEEATKYDDLAESVHELLRNFVIDTTTSNPTLYEGVLDDVTFVIRNIDNLREFSQELDYIKEIEEIRKTILSDANFEFSPLSYTFDQFYDERAKVYELPKMEKIITDQNSASYSKIYAKILIEYLQSPQYWNMELYSDIEDSGQIYDLLVWSNEVQKRSYGKTLAVHMKDSVSVFMESKRAQQDEKERLLLYHRKQTKSIVKEIYWAFHSWMAGHMENVGTHFEGEKMKYVPLLAAGAGEFVDFFGFSPGSSTLSTMSLGISSILAPIQLGARIVNTLYAIPGLVSIAQHLLCAPMGVEAEQSILSELSRDIENMTAFTPFAGLNKALYYTSVTGMASPFVGVAYYNREWLFQKSVSIVSQKKNFRDGMVLGSLTAMAFTQRHETRYTIPDIKRSYLINEIDRIVKTNEPLTEILPRFELLLRDTAPALAEHINATLNAWKWKKADESLLKLINTTFANKNKTFESEVSSRYTMKKLYAEAKRVRSINLENFDAEYEELKQVKTDLEQKIKKTRAKKDKFASDTSTSSTQQLTDGN